MATQPSGAKETATRQRVIDAAVACILERGFYRATSNEVARGAGVTWGVIQYHFGTREALMLAVLEDGARRFAELVQGASIDGDTETARIEQLLDVLMRYYGTPEYLAYMQVQLNMAHDPATSAEVRNTMRDVEERSNTHVRRLLQEALEERYDTADLAVTVFLSLRGLGVSQQLLATQFHDGAAEDDGATARQRALLAEMVARFLSA
jgi:AcrR family transcriptional regulator